MDVTIDTTEIQKTSRNYFENIFQWIGESEEMYTFLETCGFLILMQKNTKSLSRSITSNDIKTVIKFSDTKNPGSDIFTFNFISTIKK